MNDNSYPPASVDYETDQAVQETIAKEFADHTILCIAHRIKFVSEAQRETRQASLTNSPFYRTIIGYDRICVMDAGQIAELDTPENLYADAGSIFRSMCERSGITLADIHAATKERELEKGDA